MLCSKIILAIICVFSYALSADILLLSSVASVSHSRWYSKLTILLAKHGHQITILDTDKKIYDHSNITHRTMGGAYVFVTEMEEEVKKDPNALDKIVESNTILDNFILLADPESLNCAALMESEGLKNFLKEFKGRKFDLIIADAFCECFYGLVWVFGNPPLIPATPYMDSITSNFVGLYDNPSYVPVHMSSLNPKMSFSERLINTFYTIANIYIINYYYLPQNDAVIRKVLGSESPKLEEIIKNNVLLILTGHSHVLQGVKPLPPNYIPLPGFHIDPVLPLPQEIQSFLDGAKDGAILFSLGSNFKSILMSEEKREMFLSVFKSIPQRVIWKLELNSSFNIPENVLIKKWLPQSDILGHPNIRVFISHGGLLGTQEAVHRGIPILGLPLLGDQTNNLERLETFGVAIRMHYKKLNKQYIAKNLNEILNDPSYTKKMKELSAAFKDDLLTPQERALYWIEYVIRNGKSKKNYLMSASTDLSWYQRLLFDVAAFVFLCLFLVFTIIKLIATSLFNFFFYKGNETSKTKTS